MISFTQKGNFSRLSSYLERTKELARMGILDKYGRMGVEALASATPTESGETARSWSYKIERRRGSTAIAFYNSHIHDGVSIAIILQYGHATRNGGWVEGIDYINPAIQPIFEQLVAELWREVTKA